MRITHLDHNIWKKKQMIRQLSRYTYILLCLFYPSLGLYASSLHVNIRADAAIVMNAETGVILYEKDAYEQFYPASTTKIATALLAIKLSEGRLKEKVVAKQEAIGSLSEAERKRREKSIPAYTLEHGNSHIGIKRGEKLDIETLLYGLMIASGNDAANVLAQHLSGNINEFIKELNRYLKTIGCLQTNYINPHGLHGNDHKSTAYDLAMMAREGMKSPLFRKIVSTQRYPRPKTNKQEPSILVQTNRLIKKSSKYYYPKCTGIKTGYTRKAGYCLVASAIQGDRNLIAVVLKCDSQAIRFQDAKKLFEAAFSEPKLTREILKKGKQRWVFNLEGASSKLRTYLDDAFSIQYYPSEEPNVKAHIERFPIELPIEKGTIIGQVKVLSEDGVIEKTLPLRALNAVDLKFWQKLIKGWNNFGEQGAIGLAVLFAGLAVVTWRKK
ncbi:D-alanyl-D-alanine carboxypeptidase DacF [Chlamydiales bacterium SCGC AG-110-M15]|nr:D-alanyl-D-alanine carboxypeptidase DacF [Chlamydiales bacterium SCGC AG-110-M15]